MPKGNDSLCPLGFHPQFRRPNYCKRCFREYNEHKAVKESSSTSINSLSYERRDDVFGSRDSLSSSRVDGITRSRSDLTRSASEDEDRSSNNKRPMSWSAQDLRKAVDEAKEQVRSTREEVSKYYGSTRSLSQDLGALNRLLQESSIENSKEKLSNVPSTSDITKATGSFSSYLATKSSSRSPLTKATSFSGVPSTTSRSSTHSNNISDSNSLKEDVTSRRKSLTTSQNTQSTVTTGSIHSPSSLSYSYSSPSSSSISTSYTVTVPSSTSTSANKFVSSPKSEKKTSKFPLKLKVDRLSSPSPEPPPAYSSEKSKKLIESLKEVKSEDADASYVIKIRPKKDSVPKKVEIDLQPELDRLQKENKDLLKETKELTAKIEEVEKENKEIQSRKSKFGDIKRQTELPKLQSKVDELNEEIKKKNKEMKDLKKDLEKRPLPKNVEKTMEDLRSKLAAAEQLCEELMDENEDYKKEVRTLEDEIEEMQDNFREEQADEYRDLKRELEQRAKDCRVLQFKLKKAERRSEALERDKSEFEEKLRELQVGEEDIGRAERVKAMEKELTLAKEVSMKMHEEMEKMKTQLEVAETDKKKLREKVQDVPIKPGTKVSRSQVIGRHGRQDNMDQVLRDLQDTLEREQDLKEQLRFAEEETKNFRKKLSRIEEENETLQLQLNKMSSKAKQSRQRSMERSGSLERAGSVERGSLSRQGSTEKPAPPVVNGEELDPTEMKIQLELNEQESTILRRKVEELESENMRLQKELKDLLTSASETKKTGLGTNPEISKDNVYFSKKIKMLEEESTELRKNVIAYEKEKDQLKSELETAKKRAKVVRSRSQEQAEMEEKKAQENLEKETEILKQKIKEMEDKTEELLDENTKLNLRVQKKLPLTTHEKIFIDKQVLEERNKRIEKKLKAAEEKLKNMTLNSSRDSSSDKVTELQTNVEELQTKCNRLAKENEEMKSGSAYGDRTPKRPRELTPKATLIKWVNELETECGTLHVRLRDFEQKHETSKRGGPDDKPSNTRDLEDQLQREKERNEELTRQLKEERGKVDESEFRRSRKSEREDNLGDHYETRIKNLRKQLDEEKRKNDKLETQMQDIRSGDFDELRTAQTEKHKLQKELASSQQTINVMERRIRETEETLKISEKAERNLRSLLEKAESKETQLLTEKKNLEESAGMLKTEKDQIKKLRKENDDLGMQVDEFKDSLNKLEKEKERQSTRQEKEIQQLRKDKEDLNIRMTTLETEIKMEKRKRERLERDASKFSPSEIEDLKDKLFRSDHEKQKQATELVKLKENYDLKVHALEKKFDMERKEKEDLQYKCDSLEDECSMHKIQLSENAQTDIMDKVTMQKELDTCEQELKTLRETYVLHQDNWIKEKLDLQLMLKEYQESPTERREGGFSSEKMRLKNIIEDKNQNLDILRVETETLRDQLANSRREAEDLRRKVEDLEKLQELADKHQSSSSIDTKAYDATIKELKSRLMKLDKTHRGEITKMKMRFDTKVRSLSEEASTVTQHMSKYRRERDTYKEMLEVAQKNIADLKGNTSATYRTSRADNATETKTRLSEIQELHSCVTELEDKLADSRLEATKLKNELMNQKTNFEIQLSDMQTKVNEYEEDRLLGGNARRVPGLRTRLELNWQKEREEQQRLIQETATLAKDLRQTLYEVEREKDLERLEAKRKIEQLKRTVNLDHHDTKSKVQELQRDLQDLREAHAKLRQINEKLRKEKDRTEVEREAMRDKFLGSSREHLNQQTKMERLLDEIKRIKEFAPLVLGERIDGKDTPIPQISDDTRGATKDDFIEALKKINRTSDDLRLMMCLGEDRDRMRRTPSFRRALSTESDDEGSARSHSVGRRGVHRVAPRGDRAQLHRKSQSLDHQLADERGKIWVSTDAGSTSSIESSITDDARKARYDRDRSLDRISTGSQTSDVDSTSEQKRKNTKSVFSKFSKSKSIEDTETAASILGASMKALAPGLSGSGSSITSETERDSSVKTRLKTLFKKGPPSRSQSLETERTSALKPTPPQQNEPVASTSNTTKSKTSSVSSGSSSSGNLPPVLQRLQGRSGFNNISKADSFASLGRRKSSSNETNL